MIQPNDLPKFTKGEELKATDLQALRDAVQQHLAPGMFSMPGMTLQRPLDAQGSDTVLSPGAWALVVDAAEADGDGMAVLLDTKTLKPIGKDGQELILDEDDPDYDPDAITDAAFGFHCITQYVGCPLWSRIYFTASAAIDAGSSPSDTGCNAFCPDVCWQLSTCAGIEGGLVGGPGSPGSIKWDMEICPSPAPSPAP